MNGEQWRLCLIFQTKVQKLEKVDTKERLFRELKYPIGPTCSNGVSKKPAQFHVTCPSSSFPSFLLHGWDRVRERAGEAIVRASFFVPNYFGGWVPATLFVPSPDPKQQTWLFLFTITTLKHYYKANLVPPPEPASINNL